MRASAEEAGRTTTTSCPTARLTAVATGAEKGSTAPVRIITPAPAEIATSIAFARIVAASGPDRLRNSAVLRRRGRAGDAHGEDRGRRRDAHKSLSVLWPGRHDAGKRRAKTRAVRVRATLAGRDIRSRPHAAGECGHRRLHTGRDDRDRNRLPARKSPRIIRYEA